MGLNYVVSPVIVEQGLYVAHAALTAMAFVPICFGSLASLRKWKNPDDTKRTLTRQIGESDSEEQDFPAESISVQAAFVMPVYGSAAVYGLHYLFTHLDKTYVSYALASYLGLLGVFASTLVGVDILGFIARLLHIPVDRYHIKLAKNSADFYTASFTVLHMFMLVVSILLSGYYALTKNWIASNIFAASLALGAVQVFSLESFKAGIVLMGGMSLYDILWRYGADVMTTVVRNFDGPFRIVFPRLLFGLPAGQAYKFLSLGVGDIVVPGLFAALCLRFDQHKAGIKNPELGQSMNFRKPYFIACVVASVLGLGSSFAISLVYKRVPPTIVFVSAACILSVLMTASVRGETQQVFSYVSVEGLEAARIKKVAQDKKRQRAQASAARYAPRTTRLPNVIKEESLASSGSRPSRSNAGEE
ncbi:hypothetical protein BGZ99_004721 [Dissophora globulifera]|uniref:Signal peptide peptidase n=1 Tax=Dissophora globulifera TaxID=979702 RepID=A0A9P6UUA8_9FUNG|nr:hypothetical protein BGZ99_004721 [Dissophora globulifera]